MLCFHATCFIHLHSIIIAEKVVDDFHWILVSSGNKKVRRQWWTLDSTRRLWIQEMFSELPCVPQDFYFEIVGLGHRRNETVSRTMSWKLQSGWRERYEIFCNKLTNRHRLTSFQIASLDCRHVLSRRVLSHEMSRFSVWGSICGGYIVVSFGE